MTKKMLFKLEAATDLRTGPRQPCSWLLHGETVEGRRLTMRTSLMGPSEKRWIPGTILGQTLRVSYHKTRAGNLVADLWRPSWAEGENLDALFAKEHARYRVEKERQELEAESLKAASQAIVRHNTRRI